MEPPYRVLIVEDDRISSLAIKQLLTKIGYTVTGTVPRGEDAISICSGEVPDAVLMDIRLEGKLDGIQCAEILSRNFNVPIIYLTAHTDSGTLARAKKTGPYGFIPKPVSEQELRTTLEMVLAKFKLESVERNSRNLLFATLSAIREGVITADDDLTVQFMNPEAVKMAGSDRTRDRKVTVQEIFQFRDSTGKEIRFKELISSPAPFMVSVTAASVSRGTSFPAELSVNRFSSSGLIPGGYVLVIRDKSEEHRYRTMESTLASIVNASEDAIIGIDWEGTIVSWNSGAERMLGYSSGEIIGKNAALLTPSHLPSELPSLLDDLRVNRKPENLETVWQGKSGSCVDVQTTISVIPGPESENTLSIIARNITERKQLERRILEISEEERRRLGRDLHDSLGQHLAGTLFQSRFLHSALEESGNDNLAEQAGRVEKLLEESVTQCRDIAKGFFPTALESEGLPGLLEELSHFTEQVYGIPVEADIHTPVDLENGMSIQLFRIAQEAVANAARHGKPDRIIMEFRKERGEYILKIQDNGAGLNRKESSGLGLKIMQYRAGVISGLLEIHSPPGGGTAVICRVPFRENTDG